MFNGRYLDWNQKRVKEIVNYYGHKFMYQKTVLDLGCGYGEIGGTLHRLGADIIAVDARQDHLKMVSKKFPGIKVVLADLDREWPFRGRQFDLILDMGLLCHLSDYEKHLKVICASTRHLILETAVCDSNDANKSITMPENKGVYDLAHNGVGCRPSAAAIERVLTDCGMNFKRMDSARFNSGDIKYDWVAINDNTTSIDKRRIWFCVKEGEPHQLPPPPAGLPPIAKSMNYSSPLQKTASPTPPYVPPPTIPVDMKYSSNYVSIGIPTMEEVKQTTKKFALEPGAPVPQFPNLRVLYLPLNSAVDDQQGTYDAWENVGVKLEVFDFYRQYLKTGNKAQLQIDLVNKVKEFQPNLIHMQLQFTGLIDAATLMQCRQVCPGVIITNWSGDIRKDAMFEFVTLTHSIDYALISSTGQLDMYRRAGCKNVAYWQIGYDPKLNFPMWKQSFDYDACFIGNAYAAGSRFPDSEMRTTVVNNLKGTFGTRFGSFGSGLAYSQTIPYKEVNGIYNNTICPISISNFNNVAHYFSDRLLHCVASGRPTISWYFPGIESYFEEDKDILVARSLNDVIKHINFCKTNPNAANQIGKNGYERIIREHTFTSRILELLQIVKLVEL